MAVPKQHRSKSRQGQRRSHIFLKGPQLKACSKCGKPALHHVVCENCGTYRGREVIDVLKKLNKKEKKQKQKELEAQGSVQEQRQEGELNPEQLSKK